MQHQHHLNLLFTLDKDDAGFDCMITRCNWNNINEEVTYKVVKYGNGRVEKIPYKWKKMIVNMDFSQIHVLNNEPIYLFNVKWDGHTPIFEQRIDAMIPYELTDEFVEEQDDNGNRIDYYPVSRLFGDINARTNDGNELFYGKYSMMWSLIKSEF